MNKENAHLFIPLVQALADGKTIQYNESSGDQWHDCDPCYFDLPIECYRIKPEPRTWSFWIDPEGNLWHYHITPNANWKRIEVQEVLE